MTACPSCLVRSILREFVDPFGGVILYCTVCSYKAHINKKRNKHTPTTSQLRLELS